MKQHFQTKSSRRELAERIRAECVRRGWSVGELARRAGVSRTTIHHLQRGETDRPQLETLKKVAAAFEVPIEMLVDSAARRVSLDAAAVASIGGVGRSIARFDVATNPAVAEVLRDRPQLVEGWTQDDLDELHSLFGTGGALTPRGVELAAEAINRRRETVHKLQIVLETDLREEAIKFVDLLYRMVQPPQMRGPSHPPEGEV